jgi:hypothetical protein
VRVAGSSPVVRSKSGLRAGSRASVRQALPALEANSGLALFTAGKLDDALVQAEAALALAEQMRVPVITAAARAVIAHVAPHHGSVTEADAALGPSPPAGWAWKAWHGPGP